MPIRLTAMAVIYMLPLNENTTLDEIAKRQIPDSGNRYFCIMRVRADDNTKILAWS